MRKFEEKSGQLYGQQKIKGFCHLYIGQEACASGAKTALQKGDKWITSYRDHGIPLALGTDPNSIMAELFAKETGCCGGFGGSMHVGDIAKGSVGEVRSMYRLALKLNFVSEDTCRIRCEKCMSITKQLSGFTKYLRSK